MKYEVIDLFSGGGGLSLGFERAGFEVRAGLDNWKPAELTFRRNFPSVNFLSADIFTTSGAELLKATGCDAGPDVLAGGPPCQGFSTSGKRALDDPRNELVKEFLRLVNEVRPRVCILENVEGFTSFGQGKLVQEVVSELERWEYGETCWYATIQAADYGVPQMRQRFFLVASYLKLDFSPPEPTHANPEDRNLFNLHRKPWLTFWDAVSDLPPIEAGHQEDQYALPPQNEYQKQRRKDQTKLTLHRAPAHSEKMLELIKYIPPGKSAFDVWDKIPPGLRPTSGYPNSYGRIVADKPAPTMTRNFTTPSSAQCIHPYADRALSLREGARIQGFDDDFEFPSSFTDTRLLIGNAVPPLLCEALARKLRAALELYDERKWVGRQKEILRSPASGVGHK